MSPRFLTNHYRISNLTAIILVSVVYRMIGLYHWVPFFGDQAWYFLAARDAFFSGQLPLLGITTSITWLHQGPFWTYMLIPILIVSRFSPFGVTIFTAILNLLTMPLAYYLGIKIKNHQAGLTYAAILGGFYFSVFHSRLAYHTTLIPILFLISFLLLFKSKNFLSGLFFGFLFQSHLLTFIYWPLIILFSGKYHKFRFSVFLLGFILGILPFVLSGPVQTFGIFVWFFSRLFLGFKSVGLISESYLVVFLPLLALGISYLFSRFPQKYLFGLVAIFFLLNLMYLLKTQYLTNGSKYGLTFAQKVGISELIYKNIATSAPQITTVGPGQEFTSTRLPYYYLVWRQHLLSLPPSGKFSRFIVNENTARVSMIK